MKVEIMKSLDKWVGIPLCLSLAAAGFIYNLKRASSSIERILIIRVWGRGDLVIALAAVRALRRKYHQASISMLVTDRVADIVRDDPDIDELILLNTSGPSRILATFSHALKVIRDKKYDLVIDFEQYSRASAIFAYLSGAGERIGFDTPGQWRGSMFSRKVPFNANQHVMDSFFDLIGPAGVSVPHQKKLEKLWVDSRDRQFAGEYLESSLKHHSGPLIAIHPGSSENSTAKHWPTERFAILANRLNREYSARILLVGGGGEIEEGKSIAGLMDRPPLDLVGRTSIKQLAAVLEKCSLFIGKDSGPMHLAAAMGTPTIGMFGPSLPLWFGPYGEQHKAIYKDVGCNPCFIPHQGIIPPCARETNYCMDAIAVDDVIAEVKNLMPVLNRPAI